MRISCAARTFLAYGAGLRIGNRALALCFAIGLGPFVADPALAETRIIALGDSLTAGYGLPEEEGFVPKLTRWLHDNGAPDAVVVNAGVSGDTTAGGLARVDWTLGEPAQAVIVELGANDMLRGLDPGEARDNLDAVLGKIDAKGLPILLAGVPVIGNFGPDYQARFTAIYPDLATKYGAILYPSFFAGLTEGRDATAARAFIQSDGLHPNAQGVDLIVENIGPVVLELIARAGG
jgi:acyl-CoA thioesterase-1